MFETPIALLQSSFARGEVSPALFGRVDLAGWAQGLRTLRNFTVRPEGSVSNRPGYPYLGNALTNTSKASRLIPFIFSATQSYVIEVGNLSAQVFSNGATVSGPASAVITAGILSFLLHPLGIYMVFTTAAPHGLTSGQNVNITGVIGTGSFSAANGVKQVGSILTPTQFAVVAPYGGIGVYTSGGQIAGPLTFATPWTTPAELASLRWAQSADTLTIVSPSRPPFEIKRTSANSFTCLQAVYNNGPFLPQNTDGTTFVQASAVTGVVTLTASAPIFNANHVGALFQLTQQDLSNIQPWEPTKQFPASSIVGQYRRASQKNYKALSLVGTPAAQNGTGTWIPSHSQNTQADGDGNIVTGIGPAGVNWQYQDSGFGVVLITGFTDTTHVTGVVQPNYTGGPGLLPTSVVGGPVTVFGPFTFSGNAVLTAFTPLAGTTSADPAKFFVTIGGVYISPSLYTITGLAPGTITFLTPPPLGVNNIVVRQISQLGESTFWAFGAFSADQGYPQAVTYFPDRIILAATPGQPVGVFGSRTSLYHDFGVNSPVIASDAFTVFLNARQLNAISDLTPLSDLLVGTSNIIWRLWPGQTGVALSPLALAANPQSYYGVCPTCPSVLFGDSAVFAEYDGRRLRDLIYQFAYDKFQGQELTLYSRHLIPFGTQFQRLEYKPDPQGQFILGLRNDGLLLCCTYLREQQVVGWARWDTQGNFEDQCVVPEGGAFGQYVITQRFVNGVFVRYVERLANREVATIYDYNFLDCSLTYDGRNNSATQMTLSGLSGTTAGSTGTMTASSFSSWATFFASDVANNNEIWVFQTFFFVTSVSGQANGVLTVAVAPGTYVVTFTNGESRSMTVAADGITVTWQNALATGSILSCACRCRCLITGISSSLVATVRLRDPVPAALNGGSVNNWTFARTAFSGVTQLAGLTAVAYVDAAVYGINANQSVPNGSLTIGLDGMFTLPVAGGVVQVGLPYLCDFETLPLNASGQETIRMRAKLEPVIYLDVTETRNFLAGTDFSTASQSPSIERAFEPYVSATALQAGIQWTRVASTLDSECHTCIRQNMPLPITIRAHIPAVGIAEPVG